MFEFTVAGYVRGAYTNRKTGSVKPFTRIYCTYPLDTGAYSSCEVKGTGTDVFFVGRIIEDISVGDIIEPVYNKFGTCVDIKVL